MITLYHQDGTSSRLHFTDITENAGLNTMGVANQAMLGEPRHAQDFRSQNRLSAAARVLHATTVQGILPQARNQRPVGFLNGLTVHLGSDEIFWRVEVWLCAR